MEVGRRAARRSEACGNSPVSSASAAFGATLASQTSRTASRIASCSSGSWYTSNIATSLRALGYSTSSSDASSATYAPASGTLSCCPAAYARRYAASGARPATDVRRAETTRDDPVPASSRARSAVTPPSGAPRPRLTFLGTGYLGATYAICFAELGYEVLGFDVDAPKIAKLAGGEVPFHEPGLDELLRSNLAAGRLRFTTSYRGGGRLRRRPLHLRGHPAARRRHGRRPVATSRRRSPTWPRTCTRKALIVGKSTVPVGTAEWVEQLVGKHAARRARRRGRLEPGVPAGGLRGRGRAAPQPDRRRRQERVGQRACCYAAHKGVFDLAATEDREVPVVVTDFATAELVKVAANAFLATKISFINAMAEVCEAAGGDVTAAGPGDRLRPAHRQPVPAGRASASAAAACPRTSARSRPAPRSSGAGEALRFLHEVDLINQRRRAAGAPARRRAARPPLRPGRPGPVRRPDRRARRDLQAQLRRRTRRAGAGRRRACSPAAGADVRVYDPQGMENARRGAARRDLRRVDRSTRSPAPTWSACSPSGRSSATPTRSRSASWPPDAASSTAATASTPQLWAQAGWTYRGMGRPPADGLTRGSRPFPGSSPAEPVLMRCRTGML